MSSVRVTSGSLHGDGRRFAIVASRFNGRLVEALLDGAVDCLRRHGVEPEAMEVVRVPGAWEIPQALEELAARGGLDGLIALGVVIRGETSHFEHVAGACCRRSAAVATRHRLPVGLGVLTCDTGEQAAARAGGKAGNKGWDAALAVLEMADLFRRLRAAED